MAGKRFAYIDTAGILKIGESDEAREKFKKENRKMIDVEFEHNAGYPTVRGRGVTITGIGKAYWGRANAGHEISLATYPELLPLYNLFVELTK